MSLVKNESLELNTIRHHILFLISMQKLKHCGNIMIDLSGIYDLHDINHDYRDNKCEILSVSECKKDDDTVSLDVMCRSVPDFDHYTVNLKQWGVRDLSRVHEIISRITLR
jgi:hypothetical protein